MLTTITETQEQVLQGVNALMEDNFKHHITYVLGPFIRVHGDRVDLFHQSAKDFVLGRSARGFAASSDSLPLVNCQDLLAA
jgi:hypothetical protein